jgi:hypothetical protein
MGEIAPPTLVTTSTLHPMNLSTPTKTLGTINTTKSPVFKDFRELSFAIWKDHDLAEAVIQTSVGEEPQTIVRHYNLTHASRYLGKTEAALRLFLWENDLSPDVENGGTPLFSEDFLDLIDAYGYLFDYSKKWRQSGHHDEADNLLKEAHAAFGLPAAPARATTSKKKAPLVNACLYLSTALKHIREKKRPMIE